MTLRDDSEQVPGVVLASRARNFFSTCKLRLAEFLRASPVTDLASSSSRERLRVRSSCPILILMNATGCQHINHSQISNFKWSWSGDAWASETQSKQSPSGARNADRAKPSKHKYSGGRFAILKPLKLKAFTATRTPPQSGLAGPPGLPRNPAGLQATPPSGPSAIPWRRMPPAKHFKGLKRF